MDHHHLDTSGHLAICLNGEFEYGLVKANGEYYIIALELLENVMKVAG